jgi:hypothetical protein
MLATQDRVVPAARSDIFGDVLKSKIGDRSQDHKQLNVSFRRASER